jgi:thiol-disulfide isomerase/thioredoxin
MSEQVQNTPKKEKKTLLRQFLEWLVTLAIGAVILFFLAPPSWWQFGVSTVDNRKTTVNFSLPRLGGGADWNFSEYRGSVVVVNYWATWCPPCRFETPGLVNIAKEFNSRSVEMVGVTMDDDFALVQPFIEKYNIKYQIVLPGNDPNVGKDGMALPTTFLYDKTGRLAKKYTGIVLESTLRSDIEDLLKEM